jgi:hypothetical protein
MLRAAVPKAAVDEDCYASPSEEEVCRSPQLNFRSGVDPVSQSLRVDALPDCEFGVRVSATVGAHRRTYML